jgi:hypothetical protein
VPFDITWSSSEATSCTGTGFTTGDATSDTISQTATTVGEVTYTITCTGASGTTPATAQKTVNVSAQATAEGLWQGTSTDASGTRNLMGVITKEDGYWLAYTEANTPNGPVGFFSGTGTSTPDALGTGGVFPSTSLREFNFSEGTASSGNLTLGAFSKAGEDKATHTFSATATSTDLTATYTFGGTQAYDIDDVTGPGSALGGVLTQNPEPPSFTDGGSPWTIVPNAHNLAGAPAVSGSFNLEPYSVTVDLTAANPAFGQVDLTVPNRVLSFSTLNAVGGGTVAWVPNNPDPANPQGGVLTITDLVFSESSPGQLCDDHGTAFCSAVPGNDPLDPIPTTGTVTITFAADMLSYTGVAIANQLVKSLPYDDLETCRAVGGTNPCANNTMTFSGTVPNAASQTQQIATTYNVAYETEPDLASVEGSFAGTDGVGAALNSGATFAVTADGAVTATVENGQCAVTGLLATHPTGGNVFDATLTFVNGTGTCTYSGAFKGVATYDATAGTITVTAVIDNNDRDKGFLFTGAKAQ